jgi:hypothetical protein
MESFFLSETLKYLYLLFDEGHSPLRLKLIQDNPLHSLDSNFVFTTEGHLIHLSSKGEKPPHARKPAPVCENPPQATGFYSSVLSIPDVFHPFTPNTTLKSSFIPLLDTRGISTQRTILEVSRSLPAVLTCV